MDPASDVLLFQNEYFPRVQPPSAQLKGTLTALTEQANKADYGLKVAIIGARLDLGGVPQLYRHPDEYAKYLGTELQSATGLVQPLIVVMRGGIGAYGVGSEASAIEGLTVPAEGHRRRPHPRGDRGHQKVSAAAGHPLTLPKRE